MTHCLSVVTTENGTLGKEKRAPLPLPPPKSCSSTWKAMQALSACGRSWETIRVLFDGPRRRSRAWLLSVVQGCLAGLAAAQQVTSSQGSRMVSGWWAGCALAYPQRAPLLSLHPWSCPTCPTGYGTAVPVQCRPGTSLFIQLPVTRVHVA